jgi:hypothetical protein
MRIAAAIFSVTAFLIVTALGLFVSGLASLPDRFNPWAPLNIEDPPNLLTKYKLKRLADEPQQCLAALARTPMRFTPQADRTLDVQCAFRNVVRVDAQSNEAESVAYSSGFFATCPLALAMALFERHALQPAAQAAFGQPVAGVTHLGTYACRNVNNRDDGRRSQHASANAIDLVAFRLKNGERINLLRDWTAPDAANDDEEASFLRDLQKRACAIFPTVLGPEYNAAHANHFHMDLGGFSICR